VALLIGQMVKRGFVEGLDRPLPRHWQPRGGSGGWTAGMWLASMLTEGDHRKGAVAGDIQGMQHPLRPLTAQVLTPLEGRDDRLGHLLPPGSTPPYWPQSARAWPARSIEVYAGPQDLLRCEATTVSGAHEGVAG